MQWARHPYDGIEYNILDKLVSDYIVSIKMCRYKRKYTGFRNLRVLGVIFHQWPQEASYWNAITSAANHVPIIYKAIKFIYQNVLA